MMNRVPVFDRDRVDSALWTRRLEQIRAEVQKRLAGRVARGGQADPSPRYDDVFREGVEWLDRLAGQDVPSTSGELTIADDVWKSDARREPDVP